MIGATHNAPFREFITNYTEEDENAETIEMTEKLISIVPAVVGYGG